MKKIVFVADLFAENYLGGAELTTEAIIKTSPDQCEVTKVRCGELTQEFIEEMKHSEWIICNFSNLSREMKLSICKNVKYSIIEYDYKFCDYRSLELHYLKENRECNCSAMDKNKINLIFYGMAKKIWFMSEKQKQIFIKNVKTIKEENVEVLNSVFSDGDIRFIESLRNNSKNDNYLIMRGGSWVKGFEQTMEYAKKNNIKYEIVDKIPYHELLIKLSTSKGLVFLPAGADTCPRIVMEAQMLKCELIINENVQHKNEQWAIDSDSCLKHVKNRASVFWRYYE